MERMRDANTYRAACRELAKATAKTERKPWPAFWHALVHPKPDYHPVRMKPGKYMPHQGAKQTAKYASQSAAFVTPS